MAEELNLGAASTSVPAQLLWKRGLEVSYIAAVVCDADFGRANHVSCTWFAVWCS